MTRSVSRTANRTWFFNRPAGSPAYLEGGSTQLEPLGSATFCAV